MFSRGVRFSHAAPEVHDLDDIERVELEASHGRGGVFAVVGGEAGEVPAALAAGPFAIGDHAHLFDAQRGQHGGDVVAKRSGEDDEQGPLAVDLGVVVGPRRRGAVSTTGEPGPPEPLR